MFNIHFGEIQKTNLTDVFRSPFGILCQSFSDFEQIFLEIWQREDPEKTAFLKALNQLNTVTTHIYKLYLLRWSETKNFKNSTPDNIFLLYLIIAKLFTLKQLENIHQKSELKFS